MSNDQEDPPRTTSALQFMEDRWRKAASSQPVEAVKVHVVGYSRFSTLQQKETSIERQQASILTVVKLHGLSDPIMFVDRAITAVHNVRDELQKALEFCDHNPGTIFVVETIDRLIRSRLSYAELTLRFASSGTRLFDRTGEVHDLMGMLQAMFAAEERNRIHFRLNTGRKQAARNGKWMGPPPYGYFVGPEGRLVPCPETAPLVRELYRRRAAGESMMALAADFTARQIPTTRERPGWSDSTISHILGNPIYVGVYRSKLLEED